MWWHIVLWAAAAYIMVGVLLTVFFFSQTPYADNPWWQLALLWPLVLF